MLKLLASNSTYTSVNLEGINITPLEITALLTNQSPLTAIDLSNCALGNYTARFLCKVLEKNTTLTQLILFKNGISKNGIESICDMLCKNTTLQILNLGSNKIQSNGMYLLADALKTNCHLTSIDLSNTGLGATAAYYLSDALVWNNTLRICNLQDNFLEDTGLEFLRDALKKSQRLEELTIEFSASITEALAVNSTIKKLCVSGAFTDSDSDTFSAMLSENTTLKVLNINSSDMSAFDFTPLADALRKNNTLTSLKIVKTLVGDTVSTIFPALQVNHSIVKLVFQRIGMTDNHLVSLTNSITLNPTLTHLDLSKNFLTSTGVIYFSHMLKKNTSIVYLNFNENGIGSSGAKALGDALEVNATVRELGIDGLYIILQLTNY